MSVVSSFDGVNRIIYLKQGVDSFHPIDDIYREYVAERRLSEEFRKYYPFMVASFTTFKYNKDGVDYYTPRYIQMLDGAKIIPYDELNIIDVTGEIFTDDGTDPIKLDTLTNGVKINYKPPEAELIKVETGVSGLTQEESDKLMSLDQLTVEIDTAELTDAVWSANSRTLTEGGSGGLSEAELHAGLDNYTNKADWKASDIDMTVTNDAIAAVKADTEAIKTKTDTLVNYDDTALVAQVDTIKTVVDATKALVDEIDTGMDALDANDVNSIYAKLLEVNADMEVLLSTTQNVPADTYDLTFGKII